MNRMLGLSCLFIVLTFSVCNRVEKDRIHELPADFNSPEQRKFRINDLLEKIESDKKNDVLYYTLAQCYIDQNDLSLAYPHLLKAVEIDPDNTKYTLLLTYCLYKSGLYHDALDRLIKIRNRIPEEEYIEMATEIYFNTGNYNEALKFINELLTEDPRNVKLIVKKAIITESLGDTVHAINLYERAMAVDSINALPMVNLAGIYLKQNKYILANHLAKKAVAFDTNNVEAFYITGLTYKILDRKDSALSFFQKTIRKDSNHVNALYEAGVLHLQNQNYISAVKYLKKVAILKPKIPNLNFKLAVANYKLNKWEDALNYFEKIDSSNINYIFAQKSIKEINKKRKSPAVVWQAN